MNKEDLKKYDFVLVVDKSTSMLEPVDENKPGSVSRWIGCQELAVGVAREAAQYDDDGITLYFFAGSHQKFENIGGGADKEAAIAKLKQLFVDHSPNGSTNTAGVLQDIFDDYLKRKKASPTEVKPMIVVMVTDGAPDDKAAVKKAISDFTQHLGSDDEFGIQFLQIGDNPGAREFLKSLDDDLTGGRYHAKYDIVDTKNYAELENMSLTDILVEAVND